MQASVVYKVYLASFDVLVYHVSSTHTHPRRIDKPEQAQASEGRRRMVSRSRAMLSTKYHAIYYLIAHAY